MNNEEKVSINRMKLFARSSDLSIVTAKDMEIVLNLIEKQQKEIDDKKEEIYTIAKTKYTVGMLDERDSWYKKINEKIKLYENEGMLEIKAVLQELLEE